MFERMIAGEARRTSSSPARPRLRPLSWFTGLMVVCLLAAAPAMAQSSQPRTVRFASEDGKTTLTGYLFPPAGRPKMAPAVVLLHGRSGVYIARAKGEYSSLTLARDIRSWANLLSGDGYWVLIVDSFGPRGFPGGVDAGHGAAPDERAIRPLDAYGALRYLRTSPRVRADRIAVEGWSTGADAVLLALDKQSLPPGLAQGNRGFSAGVALAPDCQVLTRRKAPYLPYAPVRIFVAGHGDAAAGAESCAKAASLAKAAGGDVATEVYPAATANFTDGRRDRNGATANIAATTEVRHSIEALFAATLGK